MTQSFFNDIEKMVDEMSEGDIQRMKDMVQDLNQMLKDSECSGNEPNFDEFMEKYGDMFGDNPPTVAGRTGRPDAGIQMQDRCKVASSTACRATMRQQLQDLLIGPTCSETPNSRRSSDERSAR